MRTKSESGHWTGLGYWIFRKGADPATGFWWRNTLGYIRFVSDDPIPEGEIRYRISPPMIMDYELRTIPGDGFDGRTQGWEILLAYEWGMVRVPALFCWHGTALAVVNQHNARCAISEGSTPRAYLVGLNDEQFLERMAWEGGYVEDRFREDYPDDHWLNDLIVA